jgi:MoaA/NifB/PqqE/SkfB family radical SAM enzyme
MSDIETFSRSEERHQRERKRFYDKKHGGKKSKITKECGHDCPFCYPDVFKRLDYEWEMKRILKYFEPQRDPTLRVFEYEPKI